METPTPPPTPPTPPTPNPPPVPTPTEPQSLQDELTKYRDALKGEYALDDPELISKAKQSFADLLPDAIESLSYLAKHAESESVRLSAAKFIYAGVMGKKLKDGADPIDELTKLMGELRSETPS